VRHFSTGLMILELGFWDLPGGSLRDSDEEFAAGLSLRPAGAQQCSAPTKTATSGPCEAEGTNLPRRPRVRIREFFGQGNTRGGDRVTESGRAMESERVRIRTVQTLSDDWYILKKTTFDFLRSDGTWQTQNRETYDRGNGAAILLYNRERGTVVLARQFRFPAYVNGLADGMMIEVCAGIMDEDDPEACIKREAEEESGFVVRAPRKVFEAYMSPGSVTEKLHFFVAEYDHEHRVSSGGGEVKEGEDIEVLEVPLDQAMGMIERGEIADAKTIMLLQYAKLTELMG
jgi:GDP-mannose pyrophosphatase NudK